MICKLFVAFVAVKHPGFHADINFEESLGIATKTGWSLCGVLTLYLMLTSYACVLKAVCSYVL